jgi:hypothetical protein
MGARKRPGMTNDSGSTPKIALRWHIALLITTFLLSLLDYFLLHVIDTVMQQSVPGYKSNNSFLVPAIICFIAGYFFNYRGIMYGWLRIFPYAIYGTSVFLPLILFFSICRFYVFLPEDLAHFYQQEYCPTTTTFYCGQALAHMVFCSAMRTLPLLIIIPVSFFVLLKINFLGVATPHEYIK